MEILAVIGIIALIALIFFGGGILGWILQVVGFIFEKLFDGCQTTFIVFGLLLLGMIL